MAKAQNDVLKALLSTTDELPTKEVPMKRFGVDFTVQAIDGDTINKLQERCTYYIGKGNKREKQTDEQKFGALIIEKGCLSPNWSDPQLLEKYNTNDATTVISKRLLAGEIAKLSAEILEVSGFDEEEEDVKNS